MNNYKIWGKDVKYIKTEEGGLLLTSGYWGLARHFNYIGNIRLLNHFQINFKLIFI